MALKARRECEARVHEQVYSNVYLLTLAYPNSQNLDAILSKEMFVKNNKAAFQQVTYFLLNVLNPEVVKERLPSWPPLEPRKETQFRNEVMKYVNELNILYEDANIPTLMTSHLISPGGFKFAKFMLKLSQLVLQVHVRKDPIIKQEILYPVRPNRNPEVTTNYINRLQYKKNKINEDICSIKLEYERYTMEAQAKAAAIVQEKQLTCNLLLSMKKQDSVNANSHVPSIDVFDVPMQLIESKLKQSEVIFQKSMRIKELISYLFCQDVVLSFTELTVKDIQQNSLSSKCDKSLNLLIFFENLITALNAMYLKKPNFGTRFLKSKLETHLSFNQNLQIINKKCDDISEGFTNVFCILENNFIKIEASSNDKTNKSDDNEILAVPLENSSDSCSS